MRTLMFLLFYPGQSSRGDNFEEEAYGVKFASDCEVCKVLSVEFESRLLESAKKHEVIETGYSHTKEKKRTKYVKSELRLIETLDGICERILEYNIHKERQDASRFAKGQSETFRTLEGLVAKGVKVDIGIPHELWNKPSAEVTQLKTQCEQLLGNFVVYHFSRAEVPLSFIIIKYLIVNLAALRNHKEHIVWMRSASPPPGSNPNLALKH